MILSSAVSTVDWAQEPPLEPVNTLRLEVQKYEIREEKLHLHSLEQIDYFVLLSWPLRLGLRFDGRVDEGQTGKRSCYIELIVKYNKVKKVSFRGNKESAYLYLVNFPEERMDVWRRASLSEGGAWQSNWMICKDSNNVIISGGQIWETDVFWAYLIKYFFRILNQKVQSNDMISKELE